MKSSNLNNSSKSIRRILNLLGDVVLIPIYPLTKKPIGKGWEQRTHEIMQEAVYLRSFTGNNIGVSLGEVSGGLCTIDFDRDADIESFLVKNPRLRDTMQTKRVRGCNFWIFVDGVYPPNKKLPFGEWRADRNQTVIHGRAIDRLKGETEPTDYKFLNEVSPIHIRFDEIIWTDGCFEKITPAAPPIRLNTESCITTSLDNCIPASLHNNAEIVLGNIKAKRDALAWLTTNHPNLVRLYKTHIEPRFQAKAHARNGFIVESVPFLYRAIAPKFVLELVGCFYDCNRALFNDSRVQHMKESRAMLESVTKTYTESLNADERKIYEALDEQERDAFRICRDLALLPEPERAPLTFFMSFNQLGDRLGIFPMQAQRIMRQMASYGLLLPVKKGLRRTAGVPSIAGTYQWLIAA
jgi:Bifunctional DNA primase/polymerase, N-terminal